MANSIEFAKNYTGILDEVYQRASVSRCLNSGRRMVHAGCNAKEILHPQDFRYGARGLHPQCGLQDGLNYLRVRDAQIWLRPGHPPVRGRDGSGRR